MLAVNQTAAKYIVCGICHGTGMIPSVKKVPCPNCLATRWDRVNNQQCHHCADGYVLVLVNVRCPHCYGNGKKNY